jgi:hypothetical protein
VAELTTENAEIVWTVHVANAKAAWFKFRHRNFDEQGNPLPQDSPSEEDNVSGLSGPMTNASAEVGAVTRRRVTEADGSGTA